MENPATWGPVEHAINEAIAEHRARDKEVIGLSLVRTIADALRAKGLLVERTDISKSGNPGEE